jgi:hypothetical protein
MFLYVAKKIKISLDVWLKTSNFAVIKSKVIKLRYEKHLLFIMLMILPLAVSARGTEIDGIDQIAFYWCDKLTKVVINSNEVVARENEQFYTLRSCFGPKVAFVSLLHVTNYCSLVLLLPNIQSSPAPRE